MFLAASASETQVLLPIGMMFLLPTLVAYSACSYWIFSGAWDRRAKALKERAVAV